MKEITILTFNLGNAGRYVNGPGICLFNFVTFMRKEMPKVKINIFTELKSDFYVNGTYIGRLSDIRAVHRAINRSDILHHWSGLGHPYIGFIKYANTVCKKVLVGPNVIDCVRFEDEKKFLKDIDFDKLLVVNERLKFLICKRHNIPLNKIFTFLVGPDINLWRPSKIRNNKILWKGNSTQMVKDIDFAIKVANKLPQYQFDFIGYPKPYDYFSHIARAKKAKLYFSTSLSETMGMGILEAFMSGVPTISHPKIYMHGENYKTGIITNRDVDSYCEAIIEIMENNNLYEHLSDQAEVFANVNFSSEKIIANYIDIVSVTRDGYV